MHILSAKFLDSLNNDIKGIINLHPALPGAFDGARAIERAYESFQKGEIKKTGVMVHRVVKEVDRGEPLVVREIEIEEGETIEDLTSRIHEVCLNFGTLFALLAGKGRYLDFIGRKTK